MRIRSSFAGVFLLLCFISAYLGFADVHITHDKLLHFITFLLLSIIFYWIVDTSRKRCINITLVVCTLIGGIGSEFIQALLPYREFDSRDILCNVGGSLVGIGICAWYHKRLSDRRRLARYQRLRSSSVTGGAVEGSGLDIDDNSVDITTQGSELADLEAGLGSGSGGKAGSPANEEDDTANSILLREVDPEPITK